MSDQFVENILEHYGVKGMKWGVRKSSSSRARTTYSKAPSKLTDSELDKRIKRMETEKKYNQLNRRDVSRGEKLAVEILESSGRKVATTVVTAGSLLAIKTALDAKFPGVGANMTRKIK